MPRDPFAQTMQGPDNGSGNPLAVTATMSGTGNVNVAEVGGDGLQVISGPSQTLHVVPTNVLGINGYRFGPFNDDFNAIPITGYGCNAQSVVSAANAAAVLTIPSSGALHYNALVNLLYNYDGNNAGGVLTVHNTNPGDLSFWVPANQQALQFLALGNFGVFAFLNSDVVITLPAGGAGIHGYLTAVWKSI
jgi:hypothetical protein